MKIDKRVAGKTVFLSPSASLVSSKRQQLTSAVTSELSKGYRDFVLDLGRVPHIDSGGLGELAEIRTLVEKSNGNVRLSNLTMRVNELMAITKLLTVFEVI